LWKYKGYDFPQDIGLLAGIFLLLIWYTILLQFTSMQNILNRITPSGNRLKKQYLSMTDPEIMLDKVWKGCNFFLGRIFRTKKPCLRRTLVIYRWCCLYGMKANVVIGVYKKETAIYSHSWLLINGTPFRENLKILNKFTPILER
jgi:hypothetical protein